MGKDASKGRSGKKAGPASAADKPFRCDGAKLALGVVLAGLSAVMFAVRIPAKPAVPVRAEPFEYHYLNNLFSEDQLKELDGLIEGQKTFTTAVADLTAAVDNIGEALPASDPGCAHPLLTPDANFSRCMLPSRIDVARHYLSTGGPGNFQERYNTTVPRLLSFIGYMFDKLDTPAISAMFEDEDYIAKASQVCKGKSVFDPIQLNLIVMLPGQELPMHFDVPWMWGATRFTLPQWLLVVMDQSGLWADRSVPQIQGVSWLHDSQDQGGEFFFYPEGPAGEAVVVKARRNSAIVLDGCRAIHGVRRFKPGSALPPMSRREQNVLRHTGGDTWEVTAGETVLGNYKTSDFRMSLVWRARCFESEDEKARWHDASRQNLTLDDVLQTLEVDLRKRGVLSPSAPRPAPLDFAQLLLGTYVPYPNDPVGVHMLGNNLCMIPRVVPAWLQPAATAVADLLCA